MGGAVAPVTDGHEDDSGKQGQPHEYADKE